MSNFLMPFPTELSVSSHAGKVEHKLFYSGKNLHRAKDIRGTSRGHAAKCWCLHQDWSPWAASTVNKTEVSFFSS